MDFGELILDDGFASERPPRKETDIRKDFQEVQRSLLLEMHKVHCNQGPLLHAIQKHQEERTDIRDMLDLYNVQLGLMEEEMKQVEVESVHLYLKIENRKKILELLEALTSVMEMNDKYLFVLNEGNFTDSSFAVAEQEVKVESPGEPSTSTDGISSCTLTRRQLPLMLEALQKLSKSLHQLQPKSHGGSKISEISDLFAVKERLALFKSVATNFCQKFSQTMKEIILQQSTEMLNERGRYSRKGYLVLIDHGSISSALNKFQPFCQAIVQLEGPSNSKTIPSIANYYEEQMEKVYEKELKAFTSVFFENYLIIRRKTDEELLFTCTNSAGMIAVDDRGIPTLIKKYGTRIPLDEREDQGTKTLTNLTPASEIHEPLSTEPLDPIQGREEAVLSAMNKMKSATAKLQLDCKLAIDDKLYPDAALDYLLQNKLPLILKEFHFCQALFFSKKSCIPEGYHYSILKRHMARMFDAFIKTVDHLIRVTLSKVYQSQFTAVELILILDKNFNAGKLSGTKPSLIKDSYPKVSVDSTYSKRSTGSKQDLMRDSALSDDLDIHLSGDEEEETLEEDLQNIGLKELEPFDFLLDHLKGWKVFLTSQFKQFIDTQVNYIVAYRKGFSKKRPTNLLVPIRKYPGFLSTLHLISQHCNTSTSSSSNSSITIASALIHESVTRLFEEIMTMLREIQDQIPSHLISAPNAEKTNEGMLDTRDLSIFSFSEYSLTGGGIDDAKSSLRYETSSSTSGTSLKSSTKTKVAALGFFYRKLDRQNSTTSQANLITSITAEESSNEPTTSKASILFDNLILLLENYHYLSVRLGYQTFGTFFSPNTTMQLRQQYEYYLDGFCNAILKVSFPKLILLAVDLRKARETAEESGKIKENDLGKMVQLKSGTLKDHKKTLALVAKRTLKLLSKELGLFPIVWHQFEVIFIKFILDTLFPALEALQHSANLQFPFTKDDIKHIFSDIPLQLLPKHTV